MQKITPFLWFDTQAEEAARYYVSVFNNSNMVTSPDTMRPQPRPRVAPPKAKDEGKVVRLAIETRLQNLSRFARKFTGGPQLLR